MKGDAVFKVVRFILGLHCGVHRSTLLPIKSGKRANQSKHVLAVVITSTKMEGMYACKMVE